MQFLNPDWPQPALSAFALGTDYKKRPRSARTGYETFMIPYLDPNNVTYKDQIRNPGRRLLGAPDPRPFIGALRQPGVGGHSGELRANWEDSFLRVPTASPS